MTKLYRELEPSQLDDLPEFLKRKPGEPSPEPESVPMRNFVTPVHFSAPVYAKSDDTEAVAETAADTPAEKAPAEAPAKAKRKAKAKAATPVAAKANGHAKPPKKAAKAPVKAKGKAKAVRNRDLSKLDGYGFRLGSIKARAAAMYAKGKGATLAEVKAEVGSVQFNLLTEVKEAGWPVDTTETKNANGRVVTRYKIGKKD